MVSRSLEKMTLIAVSLMAAVSVSVPILMYSIEFLSAASAIERAELFAETLHNVTGRIDNGTGDSFLMQVYVPSGTTIEAEEFVLTVQYIPPYGGEVIVWSRTYSHALNVDSPPQGEGLYQLHVHMNNGTIEISFLQNTSS